MPSILLVEDEPSLRRLIGRWLSRAGFDVTCAENGLVAWQLITRMQLDTKTRFDVVLSDIRMPLMSGLELLKKLRAHAPHIPVILMSGSGEIGSKEQAQQSGAFDFQPKPIGLRGLEQAVRAAVMASNSHARDSLAVHAVSP